MGDANVRTAAVSGGVGARPSVTPPSVPPAPTAPPSAGPPLPKRPKGRLFITLVVLGLVVLAGTKLYDRTIRYVAYGEVRARTVRLTAPWPGVIETLHVRAGSAVTPNDRIAKVDSLVLRQKLDSIADALRVQRAQLSSEFATLRWEAEKIKDTRRLSQSDFYDKWSELLWEQSRLADLRSQQKRIKPLFDDGAASEERMQTISFQVAGQEERVKQLTEAVRTLKLRGDHNVELSLEDRVQPTLVRIENLQAELDRARDQQTRGEIHAGVRGRVLKVHRFVGEFSDQTEPVATIIIDGSQEIILYVPQQVAGEYPVDKRMTVYVPSIDRTLRCRVDRYDLEMTEAPIPLRRYYAVNQALLPVRLEIIESGFDAASLPLGAEIRLERQSGEGWIDRLAGYIRRWGSSPDQTGTQTSIAQTSPVASPPARPHPWAADPKDAFRHAEASGNSFAPTPPTESDRDV